MSTPTILAVHAARASLGDRVFLADCRRRILASRTRITTELTRLGLRYAEPHGNLDRKSTRLNSSHLVISYAVFCLKKKKNILSPKLCYLSSDQLRSTTTHSA